MLRVSPSSLSLSWGGGGGSSPSSPPVLTPMVGGHGLPGFGDITTFQLPFWTMDYSLWGSKNRIEIESDKCKKYYWHAI